MGAVVAVVQGRAGLHQVDADEDGYVNVRGCGYGLVATMQQLPPQQPQLRADPSSVAAPLGHG